MKMHLTARFIAIFTAFIIFSFFGIIRCSFPDQTIKKARCYAHCLTLYNPGLPDVGCHSDNCRQCGSACEHISVTLAACNASCQNSSTCQQSCEYIEAINKWKGAVDDNTLIQKPPAPTVKNKSLTSLTLSWQPGIQNVSGRVVYLLKRRTNNFELKDVEYTMVFTEPSAEVTIKQVCQSVTLDLAVWPRPVQFFFTVVALTENSTLVKGQESAAIEMMKLGQVNNIGVPVFTYDENAKGNRLKLTTSIIPSSDQPSIVTNYGIRWQMLDFKCQGVGLSPNVDNLIKDISKVSLTLYDKLKQCNNSLEVYQQVECVTGTVKPLYFTYPGCSNIPSFDKTKCYMFDPPPTPVSSRSVGNLTHTSLRINPDFRFWVNITWLPPTYPYVKATSYSVRYGDANKVWQFGSTKIWITEKTLSGIKETLLELKDRLPNVQYKAEVTPFFPNSYTVTEESSEVLFSTPILPSEQLIVRDVQAFLCGFSDSGHYSYNITWEKQLFVYGTFESYAFNVTNENVTENNVTNNAFVIISGIQHSESRTLEIKPIYKESWIKGVTFEKVIKAPGPNENQLTVRSPGRKEEVENTENNTFTLVISWMPPSYQYKMVDHYQVSYSRSGYPELAVECDSNVKDNRCLASRTNKTRYTLTGILPREHIVCTIEPVFFNSPYFKGIPKTIKIEASYPRRDLVSVRNLTHNAYQRLNYTNVTSFFWKPPLFKHSAVKQYDVKYIVGTADKTSSSPTTVVRRSARVNGTTTMVETSITTTTYSCPKLKYGEKLTFQVTPVFIRGFIVGEKKEIVISKAALPTSTAAKNTELTPAERAGLIVGILLLLLLAILLIVWFVRRRQKKSLLAGANGAMIDHWEVPIENIYLEEELGEGAFGKVFKGMLVELPEQSSKYSIPKSSRRKSIKPLYSEDGYVVAIKMLHDFADIEQRREFLKEIQLMKDVGSHRNIVNMLGCGTISEPMFLIVEYLPNGDLLHYLRKRRGKAMQYPDGDSRGPFHSTYCQTYFNKNNPEEGVSLQQSRSDRVYVHTPEPQKEESKNEEIQLVSMPSNVDAEREHVIVFDNSGMEQETDKDPEKEIQDEKEGMDVLTSGDLMAFAWQVSQGMEYLSKRGYVHRDLASRNVLVGNNKEAKIADFGLTRHMYEDLYQAKTNRKLPLKWMSVEAIFDQSFTSQSDVWAYGVLLWELVTLGGTPYPSINNRELLKLLKEGYRMEKPETCDTELYNIMCSCWRDKPEDRPTFVGLREKLEEMMTRDNPYFDPTAVDESRDYYNVPSFNSAPEPDVDDDITEAIIGEASSPKDEVKDNEDANKNAINTPDNEIFQSLDEMPKEDALTFENLSFNANEPDLDLDQDSEQQDNEQQDNAARSKRDQKSLKYAKLDFDDIEFQLYRRQNNGLAL